MVQLAQLAVGAEGEGGEARGKGAGGEPKPAPQLRGSTLSGPLPDAVQALQARHEEWRAWRAQLARVARRLATLQRTVEAEEFTSSTRGARRPWPQHGSRGDAARIVRSSAHMARCMRPSMAFAIVGGKGSAHR